MITFDAMNTLFKVKHSVGLIYLSTARLLFPNQEITISKEELESSFKLVFNKYYKSYPHYGHNKISSEQFWYQIISSTFENTGCKFEEDKIKVLTSTLYNDFCSSKHWSIFPEVNTVLKNLKSRGIKIGVISNFDERLENLLENLDLLQYIDFTLCSKTTGFSKPDPEIFKIALKRAGVKEEEALHIGDDFDLDYKAAVESRLHSLLLVRDCGSVNADVDSVRSLTEIFDRFHFP